MEARNLDITIISAEDLKNVNLFGKMHTYAVVWVDPYSRQHTSVDKNGGAKPSWNQKLSFLVPEHFFQQLHSNLTVEIFSKASFSDDKFIGAAVIPLAELAQKTTRHGEMSNYEVKRRSGKVKGSVRLAAHVGEKTTIADHAMPANVPMAAAAYGQDKQYGQAVPYGYPPRGAAPYGYPPPAQYPQQEYPQSAYGGYGGQGYYPPQAVAPPPQYYGTQPPRQQGMGGMGMGLGAGLLAGAVGGLVVGEVVEDAFDGGFDDGGFDF